MMKFKSIKIENFRQYKGPIEIDFSLDHDKNFTIIRGTNGAGKTNLLNAITWCLYGRELHRSDRNDDYICNLIAKNTIGPGESFDVKVELHMLDEYDSDIIFRRTLKFSNDKNNTFMKDPFGSIFEGFYSDGVNDKPLSNPHIFIEKNMPKIIEGYFFFDGEKLEEYFDENSGSSIADSVFKLSQLDLLDLVFRRLSTRKNDYAKQIKKVDRDAGDLVGDLNAEKEKMRNAKKAKENAVDELKKIDVRLKDLRSKLKDVEITDAKKLQLELEKLRGRKAKLDKSIDSKQKKKNEFLINNFPLVLSYSAMKYTCELGKDLEDNGFIPPQYKKGFLEDILEKKKCICGCDLSKDLTAYNNIIDLRNNTSDLTNVSEEVNVTLRDLKSDMSNVKSFNKLRMEFNESIRDDKKELSEVEKEIEAKESDYDKIDHPLINKIKADIKDYDYAKEKQLSIKINSERDYDDAKNKIEEYERQLRTININNDKSKKLEKYNSFCESAMELVEGLKEDLIESLRAKIEKSTENQFKKLMWKDNFDKVLIDKNYDVTLKDVTGEYVTPSILSAGEKLVLALSFVAALNSISGFELPFIIDTPMGRLDHEMKMNISRTLPEYVEENQVALLVTGEEYTDDFREGIINKVGKEYRIYVNETDVGTESKICLNK